MIAQVDRVRHIMSEEMLFSAAKTSFDDTVLESGNDPEVMKPAWDLAFAILHFPYLK